MNKRRGYFTIKLAGEYITGHFSVNFWAELEDALGMADLGATFAFMHRGIGLKQIREIVYCATRAHALESETIPPFKNIYACGTALEDFNEDDFVEVMKAFTESKLLGNDINFGIPRNPQSEETADDTTGK